MALCSIYARQVLRKRKAWERSCGDCHRCKHPVKRRIECQSHFPYGGPNSMDGRVVSSGLSDSCALRNNDWQYQIAKSSADLSGTV